VDSWEVRGEGEPAVGSEIIPSVPIVAVRRIPPVILTAMRLHGVMLCRFCTDQSGEVGEKEMPEDAEGKKVPPAVPRIGKER
jgi:hypothetical protein